MALYYSGVTSELREVLLKNKPQAMLDVSSKGTVPVLLFDELTSDSNMTGQVLDESLDIMHWALTQSDPDGWNAELLKHPLIERNHDYFVNYLNRYKYFERFPEQSQQQYLTQACVFIGELEQALQDDGTGQYFIIGSNLSSVDIALFPFVRQFAFVDKEVFDHLPYPNVQNWLSTLLESGLFNAIMEKYATWQEGDAPNYFGSNIVGLIVHQKQEHVFYIMFEDAQIAFVKYTLVDNKVDFHSTFVPGNQRGNNVAGKLVARALAWAESEKFEISASCWYVQKKLSEKLLVQQGLQQ